MAGINPVNGSTRVLDTVTGALARPNAAELIASVTTGGKTDVAGLKTALDSIAATDPARAAALTRDLGTVLSPVEQGQLLASYTGAARGAAGGLPGGGKGLTKAQADLALDITQLGLDIVGIFEPTPFADGANTLISLGRGDWFGAITSAAGMIPYIGDAAKLGKLGKWAETVAKAVDMAATNPAFRKAIEPAMRKMSDAIGSIGVDRLPQSVRNQFDAIKRNADRITDRFEVTVRGTKMTLDDIATQTVTYVKRDRAEYDALRKAFDSSARSNFAKEIASNPAHVAALRKAGLNDAQIARLAEGKIPQGYQVHHKLPLDDGGTNATSNLVLIKNDPYHIGITNAQKSLVGDLPVGGSRVVDFPVPNGIVYPPK